MPDKLAPAYLVFASSLLGALACFPAAAQTVEWAALGPGGIGNANATVACGEPSTGAPAVAVGADGSIVATGCGYNGGNLDFLTVKYAANGSVIWSARYNGPVDGDDRAVAVALDQAGDVVVTGSTAAAESGTDFATVKYDAATGALLWVSRFAGRPFSTDIPTALAVDAFGDVLVAGTIYGGVPGAAIIKYAGSDGHARWTTRFDGSSQGGEIASALAVDAAGDVYVGGSSRADFSTARLAQANGAPIWTSRYAGPAGNDFVVALVLDAAGDVVVTGTSDGSGSGFDFATVKYAGATGKQRWASRYGGPAGLNDGASGIAIDPAGDVLVTGYAVLGQGRDIETLKYDGATGARRWAAFHDGPAHADDQAVAVTVAPGGDVLVVGWSGGRATGKDYAVLKYAGSTGSELWSRRQDGPAHGEDLASAVTLDAAGDVIVAGYLAADGQNDFGILKYDGLSGATSWMAREPDHVGLMESLGCTSQVEGQRSLAVDADGNAVAVGCAFNGRGFDIEVVSFSPSGSVNWSARYDGPGNGFDHAAVVAIDGVGDVFVSGTSPGQNDDDYVTLKYSGKTGAMLWTRRYDSPTGGADTAYALAIDGDGNVLVTGGSQRGDVSAAVTIKYAGTTGDTLWVNAQVSPIGIGTGAYAIAVDGAGDALISGASSGFNGPDYFTAKIAGANGEAQWASLYDGSAGSEAALALALDPAGDVIVTGYSSQGPYDNATVKYDGSNGTQEWVRRYDGLVSASPFAVAIDAAGDVLVAGKSGGDGVTLKYAGADGTTLWEHRFDGADHEGDAANDVVVDGNGDVLVTGYSIQSFDKPVVFVTYKLDGADGHQRWVLPANFPNSGQQVAKAVRIAADGSVRVAGQVASAAGGRIGVLRIDAAPSLLFLNGFERSP